MYLRRDTLEGEGWRVLLGRPLKIIATIQMELVHLNLPPIPVARATDRTTRPWVPPWVDYFFAYAQGAGDRRHRKLVPAGTLTSMVVAYQAGHQEIHDAMDAAVVAASVSNTIIPAMQVFDQFQEAARDFHHALAEEHRQAAMKEIRAARRAAK